MYQTNPCTGDELICEREIGNSHNPQAVAMKKEIDGIMSHVPREISSICSSFIRQDGIIWSLITGSRQYSTNLPQCGFELPCTLVFSTTCVELNQITK